MIRSIPPLDRPDPTLGRVVGFGRQAVHRTAVTAKAIITDYYGQDISRNLFFGWSRWISGGLELAPEGEFQEGIALDPDLPVPVAPGAHFAFGNGVMKYLVFQNPDGARLACAYPNVLKYNGEGARIS